MNIFKYDEEEFLFEEGSQMRPDIAQFEQQKRSGSTSSSQILFGDKEGPKKRDVKADEKEQQRQEKMEHESIRSGDSKVSGTTIKSTTTNRSTRAASDLAVDRNSPHHRR